MRNFIKQVIIQSRRYKERQHQVLQSNVHLWQIRNQCIHSGCDQITRTLQVSDRLTWFDLNWLINIILIILSKHSRAWSNSLVTRFFSIQDCTFCWFYTINLDVNERKTSNEIIIKLEDSHLDLHTHTHTAEGKPWSLGFSPLEISQVLWNRIRILMTKQLTTILEESWQLLFQAFLLSHRTLEGWICKRKTTVFNSQQKNRTEKSMVANKNAN